VRARRRPGCRSRRPLITSGAPSTSRVTPAPARRRSMCGPARTSPSRPTNPCGPRPNCRGRSCATACSSRWIKPMSICSKRRATYCNTSCQDVIWPKCNVALWSYWCTSSASANMPPPSVPGRRHQQQPRANGNRRRSQRRAVGTFPPKYAAVSGSATARAARMSTHGASAAASSPDSSFITGTRTREADRRASRTSRCTAARTMSWPRSRTSVVTSCARDAPRGSRAGAAP